MIDERIDWVEISLQYIYVLKVDSKKPELLTLHCEKFAYNEELHNYFFFTVIYAKESIRLFLRLFMALSCCAAVL